jgi:NAD(P)-dependent dehydrogenase (short-subunit alcohol dehydrogenase family)
VAIIMLLEGKTAFVTGSGGRLGGRIAEVLAREGANVALADISLDAARAKAEAIARSGRKTVAVSGDVSVQADVERMMEEAEKTLGPADILVNAAGIFPNCPLLEMTVEEWDRVFAVNVRGTMLACQALARRWVANGIKGSIVNITSGAATSARKGGSHYCSSKAAANMLTHVLAIELGPHGIRVNAVAPGLILDEVVKESQPGIHPYVEMMLQATPLKRTGNPDDIAETVAFLASERAAWTTGAILEVTGGSHCGRPHVPLTRDLR